MGKWHKGPYMSQRVQANNQSHEHFVSRPVVHVVFTFELWKSLSVMLSTGTQTT